MSRKPSKSLPVPPPLGDSVSFLQNAAFHIAKNAAQRDCDTERSMPRAVAAFNTLTGHELTERDGNVFMAVLKLARAQTGVNNGAEPNLDDYVDAAVYVAFAGETQTFTD